MRSGALGDAPERSHAAGDDDHRVGRVGAAGNIGADIAVRLRVNFARGSAENLADQVAAPAQVKLLGHEPAMARCRKPQEVDHPDPAGRGRSPAETAGEITTRSRRSGCDGQVLWRRVLRRVLGQDRLLGSESEHREAAERSQGQATLIMARTTNLRSRRNEAQLHALAGVEREIRVTDPSGRRKYLKDFSQAFRSYDSVLNPEHIKSMVGAADLVLIGDYHALPAAQRFAASLLEERAQPGDRPVILGSRDHPSPADQHILDEWWRREIDERRAAAAHPFLTWTGATTGSRFTNCW